MADSLKRFRVRLAEFNRARRRRGFVFPLDLGSKSVRQMMYLTLALLALFGAFAWSLSYLTPVSPGREIALSELSVLAADHQVVSATIDDFDHRVEGTYQESASRPLARWWVTLPSSDSETPALIKTLTDGGATVSVDRQSQKYVLQFLTQYLLPLVILANLFALIFLGAKTGGDAVSGLVQFGGIGRGRNSAGETRITFADVAGAEVALVELREVRDYLVNPARFAHLGATAPKGVLMYGPPGCGKTLMARAVAGESGVPFYSISGAEFVESLVGVGAARVRDLFRQVRHVAPAIVFIDEIDAAGRRRGGVAGGQEEREQTLNQLLIEMDGFEATAGIVVIGATNRPDILDPALLRPGRFDRQVTVEPPDLEGREAILRLHARSRPISPDVDFAHLAQRTPGFTGADLGNVVNEAALLGIRAGRPEVGPEEFDEAVMRVLGGPKRKGHLMTPEERSRVAHHEAGHALVAAAMGRLDDIHRISIVSRSRSLGEAQARKSWQDRVVLTRQELLGEIVVTVGGRAAETVVFGDPSTGAEDDIAKATAIALNLAGRFGMSDRIGPVRLLETEGSEFLGGATVPMEVTTGTVLADLHGEVRAIIEAALGVAVQTLTENRATFDTVVAALLEHESLEQEVLTDMLRAVPRLAVAVDPGRSLVAHTDLRRPVGES